jgi:hypothetical protein
MPGKTFSANGDFDVGRNGHWRKARLVVAGLHAKVCAQRVLSRLQVARRAEF